MKKILGLALIVLILLFASFKFNEYQRNIVLDGNTIIDVEATELKSMLDVLYQDEYNTKSTYEEIIDEFGPNVLYYNLVQAEAQHMFALEQIYTRYDLQIPDMDAKTPNLPNDLLETYTLGKEAEEANIALYDKYLDEDLPDDVRFTFERLMNASYHHLDAFNQVIANDGNLDAFTGLRQGGMRGRNFRNRP
ncbi:MAG: DUF2202 domain-containing protein [Bacilli bacterium]|nr:DUF2202 domain-containing protein [Bacilli bacterium]